MVGRLVEVGRGGHAGEERGEHVDDERGQRERAVPPPLNRGVQDEPRHGAQAAAHTDQGKHVSAPPRFQDQA